MVSLRTFFDQGLLPLQFSRAESPPPAPFLSKLLVELLDSPGELRRQLNQMANWEEGLQGRLLGYEQALSSLIRQIYTRENIYALDPSIRALALRLLLHYGGTSSVQAACELLEAERSPLIFQEILPLFAEKPIDLQIAFGERLNAFLRLADNSQRPFIEYGFDYLIKLYDELQPGNLHLRSLITTGLNLIYDNLNDSTKRRQILELNLPILR